MGDRGSISKVSNVPKASNTYDKNNSLKKNNLHTAWNFPNKKHSSKEDNLSKNKKTSEDSKKVINDNKLLNDDKIEIDFFRLMQETDERAKEEIIACKIVRGEYTSREDLNYLNINNSELLKKAIVIGNQRKRLEEKLRFAENKQEAQNIIFRYKDLANKNGIPNDGQSLDGGSTKMMMLAAIEKAESKYRNNLLDEDDIDLEISLIEAGII